jgi:integrase
VLKFYCPIQAKRIRKNCGTRDRREASKILRECRERLLNGQYIASGGAITQALAAQLVLPPARASQPEAEAGRTWHECYERYFDHCKVRLREKSLADISSRLQIAERILDARQEDAGLTARGGIEEYTSLDALEYLQDRLLAGDEGRYDTRAPMTVNTNMVAVMGFVRFCYRHGWIEKLPMLTKLPVDDVMKGRPITVHEFEQMIDATPEVVGQRACDSWQFLLRILWETAFRVGEVMNFSWDDQRRIHPLWSDETKKHPTLAIPSSQKNKKAQEIPMLPGLQELLNRIPTAKRHGWIVNPLPIDYQIQAKSAWFKPADDDLRQLAREYNNIAIATACGVTETTVRKWLTTAGIHREQKFDRHHGHIEMETIDEVRKRATRCLSHQASRANRRLSKDHVSRIISLVGAKANIVVQQADEETGRRLKYASAHDLRRGCAQRLINAGISAETLKIILRHKDFNTTERYYGATRAAQSAAGEVHARMVTDGDKYKPTASTELSPEEVAKLKAILNSL